MLPRSQEARDDIQLFIGLLEQIAQVILRLLDQLVAIVLRGGLGSEVGVGAHLCCSILILIRVQLTLRLFLLLRQMVWVDLLEQLNVVGQVPLD